MFPAELKNAIQLLADDLNWKIVGLLAEKGKITWQELLDGSGAVHAKTLNSQLKELVIAGLVDRYEVGRTLDSSTGVLSFDLSPWGIAIARALETAADFKKTY